MLFRSYDERLTSALAQRRLHETGTRTKGQKGKLDEGAAVALLEGWLAKARYACQEDDEA